MKIEAGQWYDRLGNRLYCIGWSFSKGEYVYEQLNANKQPYISIGRCSDPTATLTHLPECTGWDWEPPKPVDPGEGWRLLEVGEVMNAGDEWWLPLQQKWKKLDLMWVSHHLDNEQANVRRRVKPDPGEGWRLVEVGEKYQQDDEAWNSMGKWLVFNHGLLGGVRIAGHIPVRRRIQPDVPADWQLIGGVPGGMLYFRPTEGT
jgi:hypothetical protein